MDTSLPSISEAVSTGWQKVKPRMGFFIGSTLLLFGIAIVFSLVYGGLMAADSGFASLIGGIIYIAYIAFCIFIGVAFMKISLDIMDDKQVKIADLFNTAHLKYFWKYLGTSILYVLIIYGGLILLIVPGIIWAIKYQFVYMLVVDKDMKIWDAFKKSAEMTKGIKGKLLLYDIVFMLVYYVGLIALLVGVFVTGPIAMMAWVYIYRHLSKHVETKVTPTPASATA